MARPRCSPASPARSRAMSCRWRERSVDDSVGESATRTRSRRSASMLRARVRARWAGLIPGLPTMSSVRSSPLSRSPASATARSLRMSSPRMCVARSRVRRSMASGTSSPSAASAAPHQRAEVTVARLDRRHTAGGALGAGGGRAAARAARVLDGFGQLGLRRAPARARRRVAVHERGAGPVEERDAPAELVGEQLRDLARRPAGQHHAGQGFVHCLRALGFPVGDLQLVQGGPARFVEPGVVEGDRGVIGERVQQRDFVGLEGALGAVRGEQGAHRFAPDDQRHTEQRDELLGDDQAVEVRVVLDEGRGGVVAHPVRAAGKPAPCRRVPRRSGWPRARKVGGDRALRRPGRQPAVRADQREVGEVRADQLVGVVDDRLQDLVELAQRGERLDGRVQRRQFTLPAHE